MILQGIGPAKASAIIEYREGHEKFGSTDDLIKVNEIGANTLNLLRDEITINDEVALKK